MKKITYLIFLTGLFSFNTFSQNVAIELEKMNVFYISVDNPFEILVQDYPCDSIVLKAKCGKISNSQDNCHYIYYTDSCNAGKENIHVGVLDGRKIKWVDTIEYRLKRIPEPTVFIGNVFCHYIDRNLLLMNGQLRAELLNMDFSLTYSILQYSIEILRNDKIIYKEVDVFSNKFSLGLISEIEKSKTGDKYIFYDVKIQTTDICAWKLPGVSYTIE